MPANPQSSRWTDRDESFLTQMTQSIVDVFEVGKEQGVDQSNIAKALDLLGSPIKSSTTWYNEESVIEPRES